MTSHPSALSTTPPPGSTAPIQCIAFEDDRRLAAGSLLEVALALKVAAERAGAGALLAFDYTTSQPIDFDLRGSADDVARRVAALEPAPDKVAPSPPAQRGRGRPKLGVVGREVTLLPRHWSWLSHQPGGASVTLRKLVDQARRANLGSDQRRRAQESAYRFMSAMAGNQPGFEEATRALFAGDPSTFEQQTEVWPGDIRQHARQLADLAFAG